MGALAAGAHGEEAAHLQRAYRRIPSASSSLQSAIVSASLDREACDPVEIPLQKD